MSQYLKQENYVDNNFIDVINSMNEEDKEKYLEVANKFGEIDETLMNDESFYFGQLIQPLLDEYRVPLQELSSMATIGNLIKNKDGLKEYFEKARKDFADTEIDEDRIEQLKSFYSQQDRSVGDVENQLMEFINQ
eukprot:TRINITY_DN11811_c0_g1_i1.p1 TRINITY_DN11811_c0_g1~~TRINITY_DN11811_c0_g1_i1.p1  ORF type:complete len:135 (-),score=36.79 TRINITY_DN11811_c0_g1_i1:17-421(-)